MWWCLCAAALAQVQRGGIVSVEQAPAWARAQLVRLRRGGVTTYDAAVADRLLSQLLLSDDLFWPHGPALWLERFFAREQRRELEPPRVAITPSREPVQGAPLDGIPPVALIGCGAAAPHVISPRAVRARRGGVPDGARDERAVRTRAARR